MSKFKITKFDVTESFGSAPIISMDIAVLGDITYSEISNLRRLIESEVSDWCRTYVGVSRGNGKTKYWSDWSKYALTTNDRFEIKQVIFNSPATIVFWADGTKTVVKCQDGDKFIPETGLAMCFMKKALGNQSNFNNTFKKHIKKNTEPKAIKIQIKKKHTKTYAHLDIELIHRLLREHKWSIKEFAEYVGVDYSTVCTWLRGGGIKKTTLNKLSKVLHISEEDLVK